MSDFAGEKWSSHAVGPKRGDNGTREVARKHGLTLIEDGRRLLARSVRIHYGSNSGFSGCQSRDPIWAKHIVLVGFDMRAVNGQRHFFGDHPAPLRNASGYASFIRAFERAAKTLPADIVIMNAIPNSSLKFFLKMELQDVLTKAA